MAYKFSLGKYKHSGSLVSSAGLEVTGTVALPDDSIQNAELQNDTVIINGVTVALGSSGSFGTDAVTEGTTNKYFTAARARNAVSIADGGGDGSLTYDSGSGVFTYTGPSSAEVRAHLSVSGTAEVTMGYVSGAISAALNNNSIVSSKLESGSFSGSVQHKMDNYLVGGNGLTYATGTFEVNTWAASSGAVEVFTDKLRLNQSLAGNGIDATVDSNAGLTRMAVKVSGSGLLVDAAGVKLGAVATLAPSDSGSLSVVDGQLKFAPPAVSWVKSQLSGGNAINYNSGSGVFDLAANSTSFAIVDDELQLSGNVAGDGLDLVGQALKVKVSDAMSIVDDFVVIQSGIAGTGLSASAGAKGVSNLAVKYGSASGTAVQGDVGWSIIGGAGLTGDASGSLGSGLTSSLAVGAGNGIQVNANDVQVKLNSSGALGFVSGGLELNDTILGDRVFSGNVTVQNLTVNGATTTVNTNELVIKDSLITIASGSSAFTGSQGIELGSYASLKTATAVADVGNALSSSLPLVAPSIKAGTFYGAFVGSSTEAIQLVSGSATGSAAIIMANATSASFDMQLPAAADWTGKFMKVKKTDNTDNAVTIMPAAGTIDGVGSISLDSPRAAVMLVSDGSNWFIF